MFKVKGENVYIKNEKSHVLQQCTPQYKEVLYAKLKPENVQTDI